MFKKFTNFIGITDEPTANNEPPATKKKKNKNKRNSITNDTQPKASTSNNNATTPPRNDKNQPSNQNNVQVKPFVTTPRKQNNSGYYDNLELSGRTTRVLNGAWKNFNASTIPQLNFYENNTITPSSAVNGFNLEEQAGQQTTQPIPSSVSGVNASNTEEQVNETSTQNKAKPALAPTLEVNLEEPAGQQSEQQLLNFDFSFPKNTQSPPNPHSENSSSLGNAQSPSVNNQPFSFSVENPAKVIKVEETFMLNPNSFNNSSNNIFENSSGSESVGEQELHPFFSNTDETPFLNNMNYPSSDDEDSSSTFIPSPTEKESKQPGASTASNNLLNNTEQNSDQTGKTPNTTSQSVVNTSGVQTETVLTTLGDTTTPPPVTNSNETKNDKKNGFFVEKILKNPAVGASFGASSTAILTGATIIASNKLSPYVLNAAEQASKMIGSHRLSHVSCKLVNSLKNSNKYIENLKKLLENGGSKIGAKSLTNFMSENFLPKNNLTIMLAGLTAASIIGILCVVAVTLHREKTAPTVGLGKN